MGHPRVDVLILLAASLLTALISQSNAAYLTSADFAIQGLPQQEYGLDATFTHGNLQRVNFGGSVGYVIRPKRNVQPQREWVWITPLWLSLPSAYGNQIARDYVDDLLERGYHVVGFDVGTSLGSPKAADLYAEFQDHIVDTYDLSPKARMLAISNGGLITYGYAFRHPEKVDRIAAIYPAVDFRSWPQLHLVVGPSAIAPQGLAYELTTSQMLSQIKQYNPIDNLAPLAYAGIPIRHIHGDADTIVPIGPNSNVAVSRYLALGGDIELEVFPGSGHGGTQFFADDDTINFLTASSAPTLAGDFNADGVVDAADYVVWRDHLGTYYHLERNGDETGSSAGIVDQADYAIWKQNFGDHGAGAANVPVPEPDAFLLLTGICVTLLPITARSRQLQFTHH
jgi:pimeloyl-ACP methyl ester carboxylesterase